jgi:hypothetical protein
VIALDATAGAALDKDITDVFGLLAVLLVFVFAYFSTLIQLAEEVIARSRPDEQIQRDRLAARVLTLLLLDVVLALLIVAVLALLGPLSLRVFSTPPADSNFPTPRYGLWMVDAFLVLMLLAGAWLGWRLFRKRVAVKA